MNFSGYMHEQHFNIFLRKPKNMNKICITNLILASKICRAGQEQIFGSWPEEKK